MIHAIQELGKFYNDVKKRQGLELIIQDPYERGNYPNLLLILLEKADKGFRYAGIRHLENSAARRQKLLYRRGASGGADLTPTAKVTNLDKTMKNKIRGWTAATLKDRSLDADGKTFIQALHDEITASFDSILSDLEEKSVSLEGYSVLSLAFIKDDGSLSFIGDVDIFSKLLERNVKTSYSEKYNKTSLSKNKVCSLCGQCAAEVFGFFGEMKFYTVDKPGMVTGGCRQTDAWKNFPVCAECASLVESGYELLRTEMQFSFYKLYYFLVPHCIHEKNKADILDIITNESLKQQRINDTSRKMLTDYENEVLYELKDADNSVSLNFFFYDMPQKSVLRILLLIEDIFPSRLRELFQAKEDVEGIFCFQGTNKEGKRQFNFTFAVLRQFFPESQNKAFLELVNRIFVGRPISYHFLLQHIMTVLRQIFFDSEGYADYNTRRAFLLLLFCNRLGLLTGHNREVITVPFQALEEFTIRTGEEFSEKCNLFFETYAAFFRTDAHRFIFLNGVLTQYLLNIQKRERGNDPFRKQLKGMKMRSQDVVALLPKAQDKLEQYGKNYYRSLEKLIAEYAITAGHHGAWKVPVDEINFIFTLGMNLSAFFKIKSEEEHADDHDNKTV